MAPPAFIHSLSLRNDVLVVVQKRAAPKGFVTFGAGDSEVAEAHGGVAIQSLHVWSQMCVTSLAHGL